MSAVPLALVDINNCYASCERIFQPQLQRQPVLVVGSNDGNIVARSDDYVESTAVERNSCACLFLSRDAGIGNKCD